MLALPPLPELRFAEIPPSSQPHYIGDRFSYMEAGRPDLRPVLLLFCCCTASVPIRCIGAINSQPSPTATGRSRGTRPATC